MFTIFFLSAFPETYRNAVKFGDTFC